MRPIRPGYAEQCKRGPMALRSPYVRDDDLMLAGASAGAPYDAAQPAWFALILPTATLCSLLLTCSLA